jgi:hypothetical protein
VQNIIPHLPQEVKASKSNVRCTDVPFGETKMENLYSYIHWMHINSYKQYISTTNAQFSPFNIYCTLLNKAFIHLLEYILEAI